LLSRPKRGDGTTEQMSVTAVITVYNEDPKALRACLRSLLDQTRKPNAVVVVDDCSTDKSALAEAKFMGPQFREAGIKYEVIVFPENRGKRHGLAAGFNTSPEADVFLGIDSDTVLDAHSVEQGMMPFSDKEVTGVTGIVLALNARKNLLTRLIDLRYANAFLYERAAYSLLGSVLCACGSLAFYRADVVRSNLHDFLNQKFLGKPATFGDDRRLTNYCLQSGKVVLQPTAQAWTLVPDRFTHYIKQQVRWNKSFFRESSWVMLNAKSTRAMFWLTAVEIVSWMLFTVILISALIWGIAVHHSDGILIQYAAYVVVFSYARSVRYLAMKTSRSTSWVERLGTFALAPLYGMLNITVLLWVRIYSLCTLRRNGWGTRKTVEVKM
jgi:hyaluronan synthase